MGMNIELYLGLAIAILIGGVLSLWNNNSALIGKLSDLEGDIQVYEHVLRERGIEITKGLSTSPHNKE